MVNLRGCTFISVKTAFANVLRNLILDRSVVQFFKKPGAKNTMYMLQGAVIRSVHLWGLHREEPFQRLGKHEGGGQAKKYRENQKYLQSHLSVLLSWWPFKALY